MPDTGKRFHPEMTVLDVVSQCRDTQSVFKRYDAQAGECICCQSLFDSVQDVALKYHLDTEGLMAEREAVRLQAEND